MKKNDRKIQKMTLNRETVRNLTTLDLQPVAGGAIQQTGPSRCETWCDTCW